MPAVIVVTPAITCANYQSNLKRYGGASPWSHVKSSKDHAEKDIHILHLILAGSCILILWGFVCLFVLLFETRISLCSQGWHGTLSSNLSFTCAGITGVHHHA
jgi:hypothetical protein